MVRRLVKRLFALVGDQGGPSTAEYVVLLAVLILGALAVIQAIGSVAGVD
jgi:hypothetical protein